MKENSKELIKVNKISTGIWKLTFGNPEKITPVGLRNSQYLIANIEKLICDDIIPIDKEDIKFKITNRGSIVDLPLKDNEKIYGFGLQLKSFIQNGKKKNLRMNSDPVADTGDSHAPVPFYVTNSGYGILVDTSRYLTYYCGTHSKVSEFNEDVEKRSDTIAGNTTDLYAIKETNKQMNMVIEIPSVQGVDIYIFEGPSMKNAVQRYNLFSGGGCVPPLWGLGIWYRIFGNSNSEDAIKLADLMRETKIPCDVFGFEPGWHSHSYSCSYKWDKTRFKNSQVMLDELNRMEYKVNLWEHVFVHPTSDIYEKMKKYSGDYEVWDGLVPDFTIAEARNIFSEYHKKEFVEKGVLGFKLDECDSSDYCPVPWSFPDYSSFPSGIDGEQMHSLLGVLYQQTILKAFEDKNIRTYSQVRSSHALAAPMPFVLYSDLYDHKDFIKGVVNMGFTGLLWSPEVRQCESTEDLIRRIQTVVFSPQALINCWMIKNPPWFQVDCDKNNRDEYMEGYEKVEEIIRKYFRIRMSLIPYLYSSFVKYHEEGIPPFRALVMDYPEDKNTFAIDDEYLMGDSILVAPLVAGENSRKVYLPEGNWYDFWTNAKIKGEAFYEIKAELDIIPLFIKEGTILPLAEPVDYITKDTVFKLNINCYGDKCEDFVLFEDDGYTYNFNEGDFNKIELSYNKDCGKSIKKVGEYSGTKYEIIDWIYIK